MPTSHLSVRLPDEMLETLDQIAKAVDRDRTWVVQRALRQFLSGEGREIIEDAEAMAALDRGEGYDFDAVMEEAEEILRQSIERRKAAG